MVRGQVWNAGIGGNIYSAFFIILILFTPTTGGGRNGGGTVHGEPGRMVEKYLAGVDYPAQKNSVLV